MTSHDLRIGSIFTNAARAVPDRVAVALGESTLTFGELNRRANRVAAALVGLGLGLGDRLVTWAGTSVELTPVFAAAAKLGVVFAPANATLGADEALDVIEPARPSLLVVDDRQLDEGRQLAARIGTRAVGLAELGALADGHGDGEPTTPQPSELDPHVIFFTSGSTGRPKGAVLSHRVNFLRSHPGSQLERRGPMVSPYPLFHMGAWTIALQQWQARDTLVLVASADGAAVCDALVRYRAERINGIPAVWRRILDHLATPEGKGLDLSSVRFADTGTSATPVELLKAIEQAFPNACIRVFYGSTEAGNVAALDHADVERKPGSCGTPSPSSEVRIEPSGELLVRGPLVFDGYFEHPEATASALADGWYRTGDLVEVDAEGYLSVTGRARDVIRTGGESVTPAEVEDVVADHPAVADVAVVGIPHAQWGEVVCAAIVVEAGRAAPSLEDLRTHCAGRLASYKQPRQVAVVEDIPRTPATRQVQRRLLVERLTAL